MFVGLGLWDARDVSVRGREAIARADEVFLEGYTSFLGGADRAALEAFHGRRIVRLDREAVEDGSAILAAARERRVALLVVGDPMAATTHVDLRIRAQRRGIPTRVVPGASIVTTAAGLLGLQSYKFGRATTVPFTRPGYEPESPYEVVAANRSRGLHTLVLLDIEAREGRFLRADEALRFLLSVEARRKEQALSPEGTVCVVARAGSDDPGLFAGPAASLAHMDFGPPLHAIVVPGALHELEAEALRVLCRWPDGSKAGP